MIKREDLRHAIQAIARTDPETGYALDDLLSADRISVYEPAPDENLPSNPFFLFNNEKVPVNKVAYFMNGIVPIEQQLLVKYGELREKQELTESGRVEDYRKAAEQVRLAGLATAVNHEIDWAIARVKERLNEIRPGRETCVREHFQSLVERFEAIRHPRRPEEGAPDDAPEVLYRAAMDHQAHAFFIRFPFTMEFLLQAAALNLEFFHLRFLLDCLIAGKSDYLFAAMIDRKIVGLVYLDIRREIFYRGLEIKYIATVNAVHPSWHDDFFPRVKGIGSFLVAGVWLLWKSGRFSAREIFLESEVGARRFYEATGFSYRPPLKYVLGVPKGYPLIYILAMAENCRHLPVPLVREISRLIHKQAKYLARRSPDRHPDREAVLRFMVMAVRSAHPAFSEGASQSIQRFKKRIPEIEALQKNPNNSVPASALWHPLIQPHTVLVAFDPAFGNHLAGIFHMESAKRAVAVAELLRDKSVAGNCASVPCRKAAVEQIAWVHQSDYIDKVAKTEGRVLSKLDRDTQTTADSFQTACLAVGAVFSMLDEIMAGTNSCRGFAFVRPPGHHAEPDRAMGFCLFNNIALGARYLQHKYGLSKIMIIDIDAHHGNGIQNIFYATDRVLYFSMHQFPTFTGTGRMADIGRDKGAGFTINVPLAKNQGDRDVARVLYFLAGPVARQFKPELILVACGFDFYIHDPLTEMNVTPEGYALMAHILKHIAEAVCGGRIAFIMEGGYSFQGIKECGLRVMKELCDIPTLTPAKTEKITAASPASHPQLYKAIQVYKQYWQTLGTYT